MYEIQPVLKGKEEKEIRSYCAVFNDGTSFLLFVILHTKSHAWKSQLNQNPQSKLDLENKQKKCTEEV